ncbi:RNA-binding protein 26-like [Uloborus diversus]|uniref:RNA-binding protein 26-like n=1 Tax=Uloborus diversus TaxID=327109 RepID=UPI0024097E75|nr:RNA-binding protein 26-like [Uloborus diversus]
MHVEDSEALKKWLAAKIWRLCEADQFTLAKYILALIRKEKPEDELRRFCVLQLYAFFRKNTKAFVNKLFVVLRTREYLDPSEVNDDVRDIVALGLIRPYTEADFRAEYPLESNGHDLVKELNSAPQFKSGINVASPYSGVLGLTAEENSKCGASASGYSGAHGSAPRFGNEEAPLYVPTATKGVKNSAASSSNLSSVVVYNGVKHERCSDYDKKGFCMRGNSCLYDHGSDPLIVNVDSGLGLKVPTSQASSNTGFNMNFSLKPPLPSRPPPPLPPLPNSPPPPLSDFYLPEPYNPESPGMNMDSERKSYNDYKRSHASHLSGLSTSSYKPQRTRELIGVTISDNSQVGRSNDILEKKRKAFDSLGGPRKVPKLTFNKTVLEVRKIPRHLNKMEFLIGHFRKFGTIVHIQIEYDDDPEAALVQYSHEEEAIAAYKCPEPVLDNRFIKVYFQKQTDNIAETKIGLDNNLNSAVYSKASSSKRFYKPPTRGAYKRSQYPPTRGAHGRNIRRDNTNAVSKRWELYVKKQELLEGQMSNQRLILSKLESCKKPAEREELKKLMFDLTAKIKTMQEELKVEGTELKAYFEAVNKPASSKMIPIMERECNKNQNIQNSVNSYFNTAVDELEAQAKSLEIVDDAEASLENRKKKSHVKETVSSNGSYSLSTNKSPDVACRPKYILLSGLTDKIDKENLKKHFQEFGVVESIDDTLFDKIIITFSLPEEAEKAFLMGKKFGDINLNLSLRNKLSSSSSSSSDTDLDTSILKLDDFDDDDDEDEEESEARSWRH